MRKSLLILALAATPLMADPAVVDAVSASRSGDSWTFSVTIRHPETGWSDYANGWRIKAPDGTVLGTRELAHPHADEQPFTRSLSGVRIPEGISEVLIETSTLPEGWSGPTFAYRLTR